MITKRLARLAFLTLLLASPPSHSEAQQGQIDRAISFYRQGGAYCFRIAPAGTALSEETEWTIMVLTGTVNHNNTFRIRDLDPGRSGLSGARLKAMGQIVWGVWLLDRDRSLFFEQFGAGIAAGHLRARVVRIHPDGLNRKKKEEERARLYLQFTERGSRVSFDDVPDLKPGDLARFSEYLPD
jgi:hypothetical protein